MKLYLLIIICFRKIGFYGVFSISASLYVVSLFYGFFFLPEPRPRCIQPESKHKPRNLLADFFDKEHVVETFRVAFKKGENKRRARVILLMIVVMVVIGPIYGKFLEIGFLRIFSEKKSCVF